MLALAVANYVDTHKHFPPAYLADERGKPMHSWRVLILPYLEQNDLYKEYRFSEPWDGPNNRQLASRIPRVYVLYGEPWPGNVTTNYLAVVGRDTFWQVSTGLSVEAVKDGRGHAILIVENKGADVHWMEPRDLLFAEMDFTLNSARGISSRYVDPAVAMGDGIVIRLTKEMEPATLRAMLTINGGQNVGWDEKRGWHLLPDGRQRPVAEP
jgi:hypothetical protein